MDWVDSFLGVMKVHGPWSALAMVIAWVGKKHIQEDADTRKALDARLSELEKTSVCKDDFQRLEDRFEAHASEMRNGQTQILSLLARDKN